MTLSKNNPTKSSCITITLAASLLVAQLAIASPTKRVAAASQAALQAAITNADWPQLGRDAQRTNYSPQQIDGPYCYDWKWDEAPIAGRVQPVVLNNRLFIGGMNGIFFARDANTGDPLWAVKVGSPIRHSAAAMGNAVFFSTHDGFTHALNATTGAQLWRTSTGANATAPLLDEARNRVIVAATTGKLTALDAANGTPAWQYDSGAPILTTPSLSTDGNTIVFGDESIQAVAVSAASGTQVWRQPLQGQSLDNRYPVVAGSTVFYRSQPIYFFHDMLHEGDDVMDGGGPAATKTWTFSNWLSDWNNGVKSRIVNHLNQNPDRRTFFALNLADGTSRGTAPVLYTFGNNDNAQTPVIRNGSALVVYRARHGIQTDSGTIRVTSRYDAELGNMDLSSLDITPLQTTAQLNLGNSEFRATSDEDSYLTAGGNIVYVDSWERMGGVNTSNNTLVPIASVSTNWGLECFNGAPAACGPGPGYLNFFPLSGNAGDANYPFPSPRVTEGNARAGVVIASNHLYWRVVEGGIGALSTRTGSTCPAPRVHTQTSNVVNLQTYDAQDFAYATSGLNTTRPLADYVSLDLTTPVANPSASLVTRLASEVDAIINSGGHLMPFYLQRGFSSSKLWPRDSSQAGQLPNGTYQSTGNLYWHNPGELLYSLALAYPYLDPTRQQQIKTYLAGEMSVYPPLNDLPYNDPNHDWLRTGIARERYAVLFRAQLNVYPSPAASMNALYALWLWSKNTGDWSYAQLHWADATALFNARRGNMTFYADIAGAIGYARLAQHFGDTTAYNLGVQTAVTAMQAGKTDFNTRYLSARQSYPSPRDNNPEATNQIYEDAGLVRFGWYLPVFYGLTPEVGMYLAEQLNNQAQQHVLSREQGNQLQWWYLTRGGMHAENSETSFAAPDAAWSHFLAQAYILRQPQDKLVRWLDRPWARGDFYSIQKVVAAIQASGGSTQPSAPLPPALNNAIAGDSKVTLTWSASAGATSYTVKYGTLAGNYPNALGAGNVTSIDVAGLTNGATYYFVVAASNSAGSSANSNEKSATPTATSTATCTGTGSITREYWLNVPGGNVADVPVNNAPSGSAALTSFDTGSNLGDNYGARIRGYLCPPTTGSYTFWLASDDGGQLWLSSDSNPANKQSIASVTGWTNQYEWTKYPSQQSATINLTGGQRYYIEVLHKENVGGDHAEVAWQVLGIAQQVIPGSVLVPYSGSSTPVNLATSGTAYTWKAQTVATGNGTLGSTRFAEPILNNGNTTDEAPLNTNNESANRWEAAGVVWGSNQTIGKLQFINGSVSGGHGFFAAGLQVQYTTDGSAWQVMPGTWTLSPAYPYGASVADQTYTFSGPAVSARGVRVAGQLTVTGITSKFARVREVLAYAN